MRKATVIILVLAIALASTLYWGIAQRNEAIRQQNNFEAQLLFKDQQREVTQKQLRTLYSFVQTLQDKLNIKPKQIERIIQADIVYTDRFVSDTIYAGKDTLKVYPDSLHGVIQRPCYDLNYLLYKGDFSGVVSIHDSITCVMYKQRPHRLLFIKYGRWQHKALFYSKCMDSTYRAVENIQVIRR